jgi:hypothetical protein
MELMFWYKLAPDFLEPLRPSIWAFSKYIVWHDVVVSNCGNDGYGETVRESLVSEDIDELVRQHLIQSNNLILCPRNLLIVVMTGRVSSPQDKVDIALQVLLYPAESFVDQGERRVAVRPFSSKVSCRTFSSVARGAIVARTAGFIMRVGVHV